jgi:CRP/FNR family transcriptional regulator
MQAAIAINTRATPYASTTPIRSAAPATKTATRCSTCNLREICLPSGLSGKDAVRIDEVVYTQRRVKRGESLYRAGDDFSSMYAVRSGFFKSTVMLEDGREQVTGFHMSGELVGLDGISTGAHSCETTALEDGEVCVVPYARLQELSRGMPALQAQFHKVLSREIVREHGVMLLLGSMRAEERLAAFLLNLAQRFTARGYSQVEFILRMTREEIGSYLGLKLETVSRAFSRFHDDGLISVQQKNIRILDAVGLKGVMKQQAN